MTCSPMYQSPFALLLRSRWRCWCRRRIVRATVLVPVELPELTADATVVVRGRSLPRKPEWLEGRRGIETLVTLAASDI